MLKNKCVLISILWLFAATATADELIDLSRTQLKAERKALVASGLILSDTAAQNFWPLYTDYHVELDALDDKLYTLIERYASEYVKSAGVIPEQEAEHLLKEYLRIEADIIGLKKKYAGKFLKKFPVSLVMRYFQIENKLDAVVKFSVTKQIPLVE